MGHEQKHNVHWENPWIELITRNVIKTKVTVKQETLQILYEKNGSGFTVLWATK